MPDLMMATPPVPKKKKRARKAKAMSPSMPDAGVHVHVNVVNSSGDAKSKRSNEADDALSRLRGY